MKKFLKIIGGLLLFLILLLVAANLIFGRDIPPPDLSDLEPERISIADEDNAYTYFIATTNVVYMPEGGSQLLHDFLRGKDVDMALLADILAKNEETFAGIRRGLECGKCIHPYRPLFGKLPSVVSARYWSQVGLLLGARTQLGKYSGDISNAVENLRVEVDFANRISEYPSAIHDYWMGRILVYRSLRSSRNIARDKNATSAHLELIAAMLDEILPGAPSFVRGAKGDHHAFSEWLTELHSSGGISGLARTGCICTPTHLMHAGYRIMPGVFYQHNATRKMLADSYRQMISDAPLHYAAMQSPARDLPGELHDCQRGFGWLRPNAVGRKAVMLFSPENPFPDMCLVESSQSATRILVACHRYRLREGRFPDKLEALVPNFLPEVPRDPFDGAPFRYDPAREIVWSVGVDLTDSGGSPNIGGAPSYSRRRREGSVYHLTGGEGEE